MNLRHPRILAATAIATAGLSLAACSGAPAATKPAATTTASFAGPTATGLTGTGPTGTAGTTAAVVASASTTTSADPCSLLTQAAVDTAAGQPLGAGKATAVPGTCQWSTSDFVADVDITVSDWVSINGPATAGSTPPVSVPGLGDEALNLNGSNGSLLYVRKGGQGFLLTLNGPHVDALPDHGLAKEKILAATVLERMGSTPVSQVGSTAVASTAVASTVQAGAPASSINGCTLVTRVDASAAINGDSGPASGGTSVCSYLSRAGSVTVFITPLQNLGDFEGSRLVGTGSPGYRDVPGVGDGAFLSQQPGSIRINFRKGLVMVAIVCTASNTGPVITMARTAAGRL